MVKMRNGNGDTALIFFIIGAIVGAFLSITVVKSVGMENHKNIIKAGCGELNPITNKFQFIKKD